VYIGLVPISPKTRPMELIIPLISIFLIIGRLPETDIPLINTGVIQKHLV
jgi:hypothetical protein